MKLGPNQTKWLEELESGNYQQGKNCLHFNGTYCCLGVANKCLSLGETHEEFLDHTYGELGLRDELGSIKKPIGYQDLDSDVFTLGNSLVDLNDGGLSFKEIAAFIRQYPESVFQKSA